MIWIEMIGILATIGVIISMSCKTNCKKNKVIMRTANIIGSILFVIYGSLLPAISTAVLNGLLVFINTYHLIQILRDKD